MLKEVAYTIRADKSKDFLKKLCATAPSKNDWERIKQESQILDKKKLDMLFEGDKKSKCLEAGERLMRME